VSRVNVGAVPDRPPVEASAAWGSAPPPPEWLALVNRQSLAVRLLATAVHDVNNILQVMSGAAEVLALDPSPASITKRTTAIVSQSVAATSVLHGLTGFVRGDAGQRDGARPLTLAQSVVTARQHAIRKARLAVTVEGDDGEAAMPSLQLHQVLLNLFVNAEQALAGRPDGRVRLAVTNRDQGDQVVVTVDDNGPGVTPDRRAALFVWPPQPGPASGALGLGLLVSRQLVEAAGGTLVLDTSVEGGLRAVVTLPALRR
jgi:signal transduction histidine kinase